MHELTMMQSLCDQVERIAQKYNSRRVIRIVLEVPEALDSTSEHLKETFLAFRGASPLLRETEIEFRKSTVLQGHEMVLRDTELDVPEEV